MSGADILAHAVAYAVVLAVACAAVALVINGVRNTLYAVTLARIVRRERRTAELESRVAAVEGRCDEYVKALVRLLVDLRDPALIDALIQDARTEVEPDEIPTSPGPSHTSPPADPAQDERKA
ncbi:hypothetical protein [Actinomadura geliboluensis]|uniref:hypothetical protein n=1 Tax=Actinomadura geliboluensis TaxID=882440 RepID=UPI00262AB03E|nr:hypothetical protein [Actinomadura geliboluensis]